MSFADYPGQRQGVELLQRSLERGRLGHAYLFSGSQLARLGGLARTLAKTLNCLDPVRNAPNLPAIDCCDRCPSCRKIEGDGHPDIHWVRPESKSRIITIDQMREVSREIHLKPNEAQYKVAVIEAADRLNSQSGNAFLKTLEEPPAKSILILLTTDPQRILETIISRCLRLNFAGEVIGQTDPAHLEWLTAFGEMAAAEQKSLLSRYRLLGTLLKQLAGLRAGIEKTLTARSPLERYDEVEPALREKWEDELAAAIEAEYRLQRSEILVTLQWWLRDVWLQTLALGGDLLNFPQLASHGQLAKRLSAAQAMENLRIMERTQYLLGSNVQEALALEVGLLKLNL